MNKTIVVARSVTGEERVVSKIQKRQRGVPNYLGVPILEVRDRNEKRKQWAERKKDGGPQ